MGRKINLFLFQDKSYIGWEGLFIGFQSDIPISSLMYELMMVLITVLMMIYVYKIPDESIHYKTLNPERLYCVMLNPWWLHSFQKPFIYNIIIITRPIYLRSPNLIVHLDQTKKKPP